MKKLTNRQIQSLNTQRKIYNRAMELIEKKGFQNITVAEICKEAGVSIGSFYNCFPSKNAILDEVFKVADDFFLDVVADNIQDQDTIGKIIQYFHYYAEYNVNRGIDFIKQLYNVQNNLFITKGRHMQAVLKTILAEGQEKGEITADISVDEMVDYLFIAVRGVVYHWCLNDGSYDLVSHVDSYVSRLVKSIY